MDETKFTIETVEQLYRSWLSLGEGSLGVNVRGRKIGDFHPSVSYVSYSQRVAKGCCCHGDAGRVRFDFRLCGSHRTRHTSIDRRTSAGVARDWQSAKGRIVRWSGKRDSHFQASLFVESVSSLFVAFSPTKFSSIRRICSSSLYFLAARPIGDWSSKKWHSEAPTQIVTSFLHFFNSQFCAPKVERVISHSGNNLLNPREFHFGVVRGEQNWARKIIWFMTDNISWLSHPESGRIVT